MMILDCSGSMWGLEKDTISMIEKQRKEQGEVLISAVLFNNRSEVIYDRVDIREVQTMTVDTGSLSLLTMLFEVKEPLLLKNQVYCVMYYDPDDEQGRGAGSRRIPIQRSVLFTK